MLPAAEEALLGTLYSWGKAVWLLPEQLLAHTVNDRGENVLFARVVVGVCQLKGCHCRAMGCPSSAHLQAAGNHMLILLRTEINLI